MIPEMEPKGGQGGVRGWSGAAWRGLGRRGMVLNSSGFDLKRFRTNFEVILGSALQTFPEWLQRGAFSTLGVREFAVSGVVVRVAQTNS